MSLNFPRFFAKFAVLLLVSVSLFACATVKRPLTDIVPGREVETLQSAINISAQAGGHSSGGRAFLVFKRPDRFHMAVLSPFGLTVLEVFSDHDRLTCLLPSKQTAYTGLFSEIPETSALKNMSLMKWVVAPPPATAPYAAKGETTAPSGDRFRFDANGLVERKVSPQGDEAIYRDYHSVDGVAFPGTIVIGNRFGASVTIVFDEPQINLPVEDAALTPNLEGMSIRPLADFKGF